MLFSEGMVWLYLVRLWWLAFLLVLVGPLLVPCWFLVSSWSASGGLPLLVRNSLSGCNSLSIFSSSSPLRCNVSLERGLGYKRIEYISCLALLQLDRAGVSAMVSLSVGG